MTLAGDGVELVFFDVGDTLVRADPSWADVYLGPCRSFGLEIEPAELARALREATQAGAWAFEGPFETTPEASYQRIRAFDAELFDRLGHGDLPDDFFRAVDRAFAAREAWHVFPDVLPALDALEAAGIRRAVISNWLWGAPELLHELDLASRFEALVISARVGYQKPHQGIFRHALEVTGVAPELSVHVGDSYRADVLGAAAAGIRPVLIDRSGSGEAAAAPVDGPAVPVVRDLLELVDLLGWSVSRRDRPEHGREEVGPRGGQVTEPPWRLFFGVPLTPPVDAELESRLRTLRDHPGARWVVPANVHLTLLFLGPVEPETVPAIVEQARAAAARAEPLTVRPGAVGSFGGGRRGRVLWLGLSGQTDVLEALARDLRDRLGVPDAREAEERPGEGAAGRDVRLHLTLAREASPEVVAQARRLLDAVSWPDWPIGAFELYRSHLGSGPPRYESIARVRLGEGAR